MVVNNSSGGGALLTNAITVAVASTTANTTNNDTAASLMDVQFARRLLTDGILPFASLNSSSSTSSSMAGVWNAKLIQSIVLHHLLPSVLDDDASSSASVRNGSTTTAVDLLLDHFLAKMDADEISQVVRLNPGHDIDNINNHDDDDDDGDAASSSTITIKNSTVDSILDILCNVPPQNNSALSSSSSSTPTLSVRPSATTAIINSLRDLESNDPGRLSRRRVWRSCGDGGMTSSLIYINSSSSSSNNNNHSGGSNNNSIEMKECHYTFIDRPTHLLQRAIRTLITSHQQCDYDSIPPLVYQLGLLPLSVMRRGTNNGTRGIGGDDTGNWCVKSSAEKKLESEKQRGVRLRRMCLDGIVLVLDDVQNDVSTAAAGAGGGGGVKSTSPPSDGELLHSSSKDLFGAKDDTMDEAAEAEAARHHEEEKDAQHLEEAWRWARYNSLAHVGAHARSDPEMAKAVLSLLGGEIMATTMSSNAGDNIAPFRYQ
eukprot:scaffold8953_cov78-Skeletonema_dohrnii-CCMP3373.AAC.1